MFEWTHGGTKTRQSDAVLCIGGGGGNRPVGLSAVLNWVISENIAIATNVPSQPVWTDTIYTRHNKAPLAAPQMINSTNYDAGCKYAHPGLLLPGDKLFLLHLFSCSRASTTQDQVFRNVN